MVIYQKRKYRNLVNREHLVSFRVAAKETDLFVHAEKPMEEMTRNLILQHRGVIEAYIRRHPEFAETLKPWPITGPAPIIIKDMTLAGKKAGVGPMATVAGIIAQYVGMDLLSHTSEVIVENGGDVFIKTDGPVIISIFAGTSPLSHRVGLRLDYGAQPFSVCTSSGMVGHSLSFGKADAISVVSESCALADAVATAVGNLVNSKSDIRPALDFGKSITGVEGLVVIIGEDIGMWGGLEVVPLKREKG